MGKITCSNFYPYHERLTRLKLWLSWSTSIQIMRKRIPELPNKQVYLYKGEYCCHGQQLDLAIG